MNIQEVHIRNFLSHKSTRLEFPNGLTGIVGHNGAGKSSLIKDSITWALWGKSRGTGAGDDLITTGENECTIEITVYIDESLYRIKRTRQREKKTNLWLYKEKEDISSATIKDTQEKINRILGMSYDVFRNSCCVEQGEADSFSKLSPQEASKILLNILQLDQYPKYKTKCTDKYMELRIVADKLETENKFLLERIQSNENLDETRKQKEKELSVKKNDYIEYTEKVKKSQEQYDNVKAKLDEHYSLRAVTDSEISTLNASIKKFEKQLEILGKINGKCPICESGLTVQHKDIVKKKFADELARLTKEKESLTVKLRVYQEKILQFTRELETFKIAEKNTKLSQIQSVIASLESEIALLKNSSDALEQDRKKLDQNNAMILTNRELEDVYSELSSAFGSRGIPLLIIDNMLRELEILVNENLKLLSDLPLNVELKTQREGASGDLIDTFQIMINEGLNSRPYFNYSGGEKMIIDLSLRLGLSELLARRNNFKVETLIIDEGLGSLDEANQMNLVLTLRKLSTKFSKILVITHTQAKDYFDNYIQVAKVNGVSEVNSRTKNSDQKVEITK